MKQADKKLSDLYDFITGQMEKLDDGKIEVSVAVAQAQLAKQANNVMKHEMERATVVANYTGKVDKVKAL